MNTIDLVTAMAAALATFSGGSAAVCAWAARHALLALFPWRAAALGFVALAFSMIAIQQTWAVIAYETGVWGIGNVLSPVAIGTRLGLAVSFLGLAYIVTRERCGHRGWLALLVAGLVAGLATVVF